MSEYPNYTLEQLAQLILKLDMKEGVSPAGLGSLQMFAKCALENASQQSFAPDPPSACEDCGSVDPQVHYSNCPLAKSAGR